MNRVFVEVCICIWKDDNGGFDKLYVLVYSGNFVVVGRVVVDFDFFVLLKYVGCVIVWVICDLYVVYFFLWIIEGFGVVDFGVYIVFFVIGCYKKCDFWFIISIVFVGVV